ncbi:MAG: hypothetical protein J6U54_06945 [Clostridiales bacterium]|nr:hypothetical protein [Clostridiales bacterium]
MTTKFQKFCQIGYLLSCILAIVTVFLPYYSLSYAKLLENNILGLDPHSMDMTIRPVYYKYYLAIPVLCAIGIFFVVVRYNRKAVTVCGLISSGLLLFLCLQGSFQKDYLMSKSVDQQFADAMAQVDFSFGPSIFVAGIAAVLLTIFTLLTFANIRESD